MKEKLMVLSLLFLMTGCSTNNKQESKVNEKTAETSIAEEKEDKKVITYNETNDPDLNSIIQKLGNEGIEIYYQNELGYFDYSENEGLKNPMYGSNPEGVAFSFNNKSEKDNSVSVAIYLINDDSAYTELKDRHENPKQEKYENQLILPEKFVFNDDKKIYMSASVTDENKEYVDRLIEIINNL